MADWSGSRDTRDPCKILMEREAQDCKLCQCKHFETVFEVRWCCVRQLPNPFNRNCQYFKKG